MTPAPIDTLSQAAHLQAEHGAEAATIYISAFQILGGDVATLVEEAIERKTADEGVKALLLAFKDFSAVKGRERAAAHAALIVIEKEFPGKIASVEGQKEEAAKAIDAAADVDYITAVEPVVEAIKKLDYLLTQDTDTDTDTAE